MLLSNTDYDLDIENRLINTLLKKRVDGLLICPLQKKSDQLAMLRSSKIPFVVMNYRVNLKNCNYVISDNVYGASLVVDHLIKRGYKEIYYIYKTTYSPTRENRIKGCKKAFKKHRLSLNKLKILYCDIKIKSYYQITKEKIKFKGNRIGIFAWNDVMAIGAFKAIMSKGLRIPEDIGIAGFDDDMFSEYLYKPLTTVSNPGSDT